MKTIPHALCLLALLIAACGPPTPPPLASDQAVLELVPHTVEVPRIPYPAYHPDGVQLTAMEGSTAWTRAGLRVGDVIDSIDGEATHDHESFWNALGRATQVRIASSRLGPYGYGRVVDLET